MIDMIIKIEEHNNKQETTIIDNITDLKMLRISHKDRYNEHKLGENPRKFVIHNNQYKDTKTVWSDTTILNAFLLTRNNDIDVTECRLIYDSKGDVRRCTIWLMDDSGKTIDRFDY